MATLTNSTREENTGHKLHSLLLSSTGNWTLCLYFSWHVAQAGILLRPWGYSQDSAHQEPRPCSPLLPQLLQQPGPARLPALWLLKISCLQVLHGLFMKAAELSPWEPIGCGAFSILITSPDLVLGGAATCTYSRQRVIGFLICRTLLVISFLRGQKEYLQTNESRKAGSQGASKNSDPMDSLLGLVSFFLLPFRLLPLFTNNGGQEKSYRYYIRGPGDGKLHHQER